jgi:hypothetical protein
MWLLVVRSLNLSKLLLWQEENKILDKMHRQKVAEVEKLSTTVAELEEAVLAGGAAVNAATATVSSLVHSLLLMPRAFGKFVAGSTEREEV